MRFKFGLASYCRFIMCLAHW